MDQKPELGDRVQDKITGVSGVVTGISEYLTGCRQHLVQPPVDEKGQYVSGLWLDEDRLTVTEAGAIKMDVKTEGPCGVAPIK